MRHALALTFMLALLSTLLAPLALAQDATDLPDWTNAIRKDHPRLFFNADAWPDVRARVLGEEREWYASIKDRTDSLLRQFADNPPDQPRELGPQAAHAAFVFLMTDDARYRDLAVTCLETSLDYYEQCFREKKSVNWYSTSRVHATMAWDWLYGHLDEGTRRRLMQRLVHVIDDVITAKPSIYRENMSGYNTGFYGVRNCLWFIGCTAFGTGIETDTVNEWLVWGHDENLKLLAHRRKACGDDGGGASPTLGYVFGAYPWAEQNFFYTWLSATGENIAPDWPHGAWLANYVIWNWIQAKPHPLQFGYGDTPHTDNRLPVSQLYTHMANIRHLYDRAAPEAAALARHIQTIVPKPSYPSSWFIYPFLLHDMDASPASLEPNHLPHARHFENMGQIVMRSGASANDTYCLFTCGGILSQHRHFDALNFVIYHRGFLALDSGTRYDEFTNGEHLANYFAQTVAHNCVVIHQPGEPLARYWGGTVEGNHGGQHRQLGSTVEAFESTNDFVYVAGDATACYRHGKDKTDDGTTLGEKCELATRQIVFVMPHHFVIFDRVTSTDPTYHKQWLLHTAKEPSITGCVARADHGEGRMFCETLLPKDATLTAVGGPGREFYAAGRNWEVEAPRLKPEHWDMMGRWRLEVSPSVAQKEELFLHVIQVGPQSLEQPNDVQLVETNDHPCVRISLGDDSWEVRFARSGPLGGAIHCKGPHRSFERPLADTVALQSGIMSQEESTPRRKEPGP